MAQIAGFIAAALRDRDTPATLAAIKADVATLCARFPAYLRPDARSRHRPSAIDGRIGPDPRDG